jgi:hypothetical protein
MGDVKEKKKKIKKGKRHNPQADPPATLSSQSRQRARIRVVSLELPRFSPFPSLEIGRERNGGFMRTRKQQLEVPLFSVGPMGKQLFQGDGSHPRPAQLVEHAGPMPRSGEVGSQSASDSYSHSPAYLWVLAQSCHTTPSIVRSQSCQQANLPQTAFSCGHSRSLNPEK